MMWRKLEINEVYRCKYWKVAQKIPCISLASQAKLLRGQGHKLSILNSHTSDIQSGCEGGCNLFRQPETHADVVHLGTIPCQRQ